MCNCKFTEIILGIVVLIFAIWPLRYSKIILVIAAILLILHAVACKNVNCCDNKETKPAKKKRK